ncbi:MAG: response regulator [Candidatus Omnitrophica bacterium]|nr:response regulator [Candidatus Omnitrophota bacterium]
MKILIVDDETDISELYVRYLKRSGFTDTMVAHNSQTAIELIEKDRPNLVVLDISLGADSKGTGMDVLARVSKTAPECKICMMSAYREEYEKICLDLGAYVFISKPFQPDVLLEIINRASQAGMSA